MDPGDGTGGEHWSPVAAFSPPCMVAGLRSHMNRKLTLPGLETTCRKLLRSPHKNKSQQQFFSYFQANKCAGAERKNSRLLL